MSITIPNVEVTLTDRDRSYASRPDARTVKVRIESEGGHLYLHPEGYGEPEAARGHGSPVLLELYQGRLTVWIVNDILDDNSRAGYDLENAREDRVTDWEDSPDGTSETKTAKKGTSDGN